MQSVSNGLPQEGKEVLVKLSNGAFTVARWMDLGCYSEWVVGIGVKPILVGDLGSVDPDNVQPDTELTGKVVAWSDLPND